MANLKLVYSSKESVGIWVSSCGCSNSKLYFNSDFGSRVCQNCGVVVTEYSDSDNFDLKIPFVHLRVHTHLSFLKSICQLEDIINKAKESGMSAVAKTEFGNLCGAPSFVKQCKEAGIKPILGIEFDVIFGNVKQSITFIALNAGGYKNLVKMSTVAWCDRKKKDNDSPHILASDIQSDGLVAIVEASELADPIICLLKNQIETYVEATSHAMSNSDLVVKIATRYNIPALITNNVLYTNAEDHEAFKVALKIGKHTQTCQDVPEYYFKNIREMLQLNLPVEWYENTAKLADRVEDYGLINKDCIIPTFKDKHGEWSIEQAHGKLSMDAWMGLVNRGLIDKEEYTKRLTYELDVIQNKKFSSYFLIIADIIDFIKKSGDLVPFGRGSSAGALTCYVLGITAMDPIKWNIPFERFINPGRKDLPDVDTDIMQESRGNVLKHIADIHGYDKVAQIATYQTMGLKASIDNVGRALGVSHSQNRDLRNKIPEEIDDMEKLPDDIKNELAKVPGWIDIAIVLNGVAKNLGVHAAGLTIANVSMSGNVPLLPESDGLSSIQYDMKDVEILGMLKLDMLGLKNLDIIHHTTKKIEQNHGIKIDVHNIPIDDKKAYELISSGDYVSLFQLDSPSYRKLCRQLKPENFDHVMALNALFRPGPLEGGMTAEYVERRHNRHPIDSMHPWLDQDLAKTYQLIVYQEQLLALSKKIAGFDDIEADKFRAAVGKKNKIEFDKGIKKFRDGALQRQGLQVPPGWSGTLEQWIDDLIEKISGHARYSWNCLSENTIIYSYNRGYIKIKDVKIGEEIASFRNYTGDLFRNKVINLINNGVCRTFKIITKSGRNIRCTSNHRVFTAEHGYKYVSELRSGNFIKVFKKWAPTTNLNIGMTPVTDSSKIPIRIGADNIKWYDMVQLQLLFRLTKNTTILVALKKFFSIFSVKSLISFKNNIPIQFTTSDKIKDVSSIDLIAQFQQSPVNSQLAGNTTIINKSYVFNHRRCKSKDWVSSQSPRSQLSGQRSFRCFEWQFFKYILAAPSIIMQFFNKLFILEKWIIFFKTSVTIPFVSRPHCYDQRSVTFCAPYGFNVGTYSTFGTKCDSMCSVTIKQNITTQAKSFHKEIFNYWNVPGIDTWNVSIIDDEIMSIDEHGDEVVYDLTMEQDPNFLADGFWVHNCGHSASYGAITYVTAYLEAYYPQEYYASLLDASKKSTDKVAQLIRSVLHKGHKIVPPHINESSIEYGIGSNGMIYMGLAAIRGVGHAATQIVEERGRGKFESFIQFCQRLPSINKIVKTNLIKSGAFSWDQTICDRHKMDNLDIIHKIIRRKNRSFDGSNLPSTQIAMECYLEGDDFTDIQKQQNEREILNSFITGHPAAIYQRLAPSLECKDTFVVCPSMVQHCEIGQTILLVGMLDIVNRRTIQKEGRNKGNPYLFLQISDNEAAINTTIWYPQCNDMEKYLVPKQIGMFECVTRKDKFKEDSISLMVKQAVMLNYGLPIQGIFCHAKNSPEIVVTKLGGIINEVYNINDRKFASIRGRITVMPDILENVMQEHLDVRFLISMDPLSTHIE